jgi:hypothetical protein
VSGLSKTLINLSSVVAEQWQKIKMAKLVPLLLPCVIRGITGNQRSNAQLQ